MNFWREKIYNKRYHLISQNFERNRPFRTLYFNIYARTIKICWFVLTVLIWWSEH